MLKRNITLTINIIRYHSPCLTFSFRDLRFSLEEMLGIFNINDIINILYSTIEIFNSSNIFFKVKYVYDFGFLCG